VDVRGGPDWGLRKREFRTLITSRKVYYVYGEELLAWMPSIHWEKQLAGLWDREREKPASENGRRHQWKAA